MIIFKYAGDVMHQLKKGRQNDSTIGFIPTMGALHQGHTSLLQKSKQVCELTVSSIFINPTQFTNADDFKKYPVTLENDIYTLEKNGCDILFLPEVKEMYPNGTIPKKHFDLGYLETILEGEFRPGHFQGVCQVVSRLLEIISPTHLFMGQKDYQQCLVIKRLLELENLEIELVICETLREANGLAMSSRNLRLNNQQKEQASHIYKMLLHVKQNIKTGSLLLLKKEAKEYLTIKGFKPDYVDIATANNLEPVDTWDGKTKLVVLAAASVGEVRLIDNLILNQ
ncbi:MAG: pantoate--beta-alanine ligase [Chitinophagaceae bacterium]